MAIGDLKRLIVKTKNGIEAAKEDRTAANADIAALKATLEAQGIPRKALDHALMYAEWDDDARAGYDVALQIVRDAIGLPMEDQLFDHEGKPNLKIAEPDSDAKPKKAAKGGKTQAEGIADHVLEEAKKATGQPTLN